MDAHLAAIRANARVRLAARVVLAIFAIAVLGVILGRLVVGPLQSWLLRDVDMPARSFANNHASATATAAADRVGPAGSAWVTGFVAAIAALGWWLRTRNPRRALVPVMAFVGALAVTLAVKYGVHRSPQSGPTSRFTPGTFPSGHTLVALAVYGSLAAVIALPRGRGRVVRVALALLLVGLVIAVACGRVYLLDHYLSDVVGSLILGVALIAASVGILGLAPEPS